MDPGHPSPSRFARERDARLPELPRSRWLGHHASIKAFKVTKFSTPSEEDLGVFKFKVNVKMLSTMDFIVISLTAGTTVQITQEA